MAVQKSQHYVPKCMLRKFSKYADAKAIDLFNIKGRRSIFGASLRHQCARNYLYGSDLRVENELADLEGRYSKLVDRISAGLGVDDDDVELLRLFVHLQRSRTESAATRLAAVRSEFVDLIEKHLKGFSQPDLSTQTIMRESLEMAMRTIGTTKDLAFAILVNRTRVGFITSDNPVSTPNRFLNQRTGDGNYGLGNSGTVLLMPVTPSISVMFYDRGVYQVDKRENHRVEVSKLTDVQRINFITFCFADKNVYFSASSAEMDFAQLHRDAQAYRSQYRHTFTMMRLVEKRGGEAIYHPVTREEFERPGTGIIAQSQHYPVFGAYPSILRLRRDPKFVDTGSGAGILRPAIDDAT